MDSMKVVLAERLPVLLRETGYSQTQLAEYCGVSKTTVTAWVHGTKSPRPDKMRKIAEFFNVKATDLVASSLDSDLRPVRFLPLVQPDGSIVSSDISASYGSLASGIDADYVWICPDDMMRDVGIMRGDVCLIKASSAIRSSHPALIVLDGCTRLAILEMFEDALYIKSSAYYRGLLLKGDLSLRFRVLGYIKAFRREWRR